MPGFDDQVVDRRRYVRAVAQETPNGQPRPPDLGEFAPRTFMLVYLESPPGSWITGWDIDPEFEFDPFLDKHLPEPFRAAALALGGAEMDDTICWQCGREAVGWAETWGEGPHGEEVYGMTWRPVGLLFEPGSGHPVNLLCEACSPYTEPAPVPIVRASMIPVPPIEGRTP